MSVFKYKNADGSWTSIPVAKGDKGKNGVVPNVSLTVENISQTTATIQQTGTAENPSIKIGIPRGSNIDSAPFVTKGGNRGTLNGYETPSVVSTNITIDQNTTDGVMVNEESMITVIDGQANTSWSKTVLIANPLSSITLGDSWSWSGDSLPSISENSVLVLHWSNDVGIATLIDGAHLLKTYNYLRFTASADATNVNLFTDVNSTYHNVNYYDVYINEDKVDMDYTALTFKSGDKVVIHCIGERGFPRISFSDKNCVEEISILPYTTDNYGVANKFLSMIFMNCTSLKKVPDNLFKNNPKTYSVANLFLGCNSLESIPNKLFYPLLGLNHVSSTFSGCSAITEIPSGIFDKNISITTFEHTFKDCIGITKIPSGLFDNNTLATNFYGSFSGCKNVLEIPSGLFDNNKDATDFTNTFAYCNSIQTIPSGLFDNNPLVTKFDKTFTYSKNLTSIPSGLFDNNPLVTNFQYVFGGCNNIQSIPSGLFDNNPLVTDFSDAFLALYSLTDIPSGLFDNNTLAEKFSETFSNCKLLTNIPSGLFDNNPLVTTFRAVFYTCEKLTNIPNGLFDKNLEVTDFSIAFGNCKEVESIDQNIFAKNTKVTNFERTFDKCYKLNGTFKIGSPNVTNANNFCRSAGNITVLVPSGSTTESTFRAYAETVTNLTVETY